MAVDTGKRKNRDNYCCVPLCNGNARIHIDLNFHHIPSVKKMQLRRKWIVAIRRDEGPNFKIVTNTVVCSRHFKQQDYRWTPNRRCLKPDAVPSIFTWSTERKARKPPAARQPIAKKVNNNILEEFEIPCVDIYNESHKPMPENPSPMTSDESCELHIACKSKITDLEERLRKAETELEEKERQMQNLNKKINMEKFGLNRFTEDDEMIEFYTGFPTYEVFITFFNSIKPTAIKMKGLYYSTGNDLNIRGRQKAMDPVDELFMFLCRLRCGFPIEDMSVRFNIHKSSVSRKIIMWTNYLYFLLGSINIWPSHEQVQANMPLEFQLSYPGTRIIIDCTEIFTERPSSLVLASKTFSNYKTHNTWKGLVGIAPHGAITFVSSLYSGCMSDVEITKLSGLIDLLEPGDQIMADKGFVLHKVLEGTGVSIATPHFLCSDGQFTASQVEDNQKIASLRIHVERHIKRVKEYKLLQSVVPLTISGSINQLWTVANVLTLFKRPLIKQNK